jgi:hypothetical protein
MKRACFALVLIALVAGCENKSTPTPSPTPTPTPTPNPIFVSTLLAANEVPPIGGVEQNASGTVRIELIITRDAAGAISTATANFTVTLAGFPAGASVNIAHIHQAPAGTNAGIAVNTGLTSGEVTLTNGSGGFTKNGVVFTTPSLAQAIIDAPAGFYFNVHSTANPGGVIRGQLARQ